MAFLFDQIMGLLARPGTRMRPGQGQSRRPEGVSRREYKAASTRPATRGVGWQGPINSEVGQAKQRMDGRIRHLVANDPYAKSAIDNLCSSAIGTGVLPRFQGPRSQAELLHRLWHEWGRRADADGLCDIYGLQALAMRQLIETGEIILLVVYRRDELRLRLIPSALLPTDRTQTLPGGGHIIQGVEFDADGERVAYHIHRYHPGEAMGLPSETVRVPARDVIHCFVPLEAGQVRGVSWFAPIVQKLYELSLLEEAEIKRTMVQSLFGGFIRSPDLSTNLGIVEEEEAAALGAFEEEIGHIGYMEPGTLYKLADGEDITFPQRPQDSGQGVLEKHTLRAIATGLGIPYSVLTGDVSDANYSSIRTAMIEYRRRIERIQWTVLVPQLLTPIWRLFIDRMVLTGRVRETPNVELMAVEWRFPRWPWVDPSKDMQSEIDAIAYGLKSRAQAVAELGYDVEDLDLEIARDRDREARLGLAFGKADQRPPAAEEPPEGSVPSPSGGSPTRNGAEILVRLSPHSPSTVDEDAMTCIGILSTGAGVMRSDFDGRYLEILSLAQGAVTVAQEGRVSLLNAHRRDSTGDVIGSVFDVRVEGGRLLGTLQFSKRPGVRSIFEDVAAGHLRGLSVGYRPLEWNNTTDRQTGDRVRTVTRWELVEVSLVPVAADGGAVIRS